jgi:hypothetical protein
MREHDEDLYLPQQTKGYQNLQNDSSIKYKARKVIWSIGEKNVGFLYNSRPARLQSFKEMKEMWARKKAWQIPHRKLKKLEMLQTPPTILSKKRVLEGAQIDFMLNVHINAENQAFQMIKIPGILYIMDQF